MSKPAPVFPSTEPRWAELVPADQWAVLLSARDAAARANVPFLLGGAMALATYTGRWRNTKDIDFIIRERHRNVLIEALGDAGFEDYHGREAYDRSWIYRGFRDGVVLDLIWTLPNHRVVVDDGWFTHARLLHLRAHPFHVLPIEELVWIKLYVMQRERCDWVDVLNVLAGSLDLVDWRHLVNRMGRDVALLHAVLAVFNWMCPGRAAALPGWVRERFALSDHEGADAADVEERRVRLFDSRPWFASSQPEDQPLER